MRVNISRICHHLTAAFPIFFLSQMDDEVILAAILLAAAGLLLILTIIMLCIIVNTAKSRSRKDTSRSEIPNSSHQYGNSGFQRENGVSMHENIPGNTATRVSHNDEYKAEWPTSYNMYAVSRSYAFPKAGDHSEQSSELGSKAQPSNPPSTLASRSSTLITREVFGFSVKSNLSTTEVRGNLN